MAERELFQIGEVARMYHLSVGTLRHYERIGLLAPERTDPATDYRYYSARQLEQDQKVTLARWGWASRCTTAATFWVSVWATLPATE